MFAGRLSRRQFLGSATVAALGAALAACAPKATPAPAAQATTAPAAGQPAAPAAPTSAPAKKEAVTVRWQGGGGAALQPTQDKLIAEDFAPNNPGINLVIEPKPDGWTELLLTQMIAGTAPDILETWGNMFWAWGDRDLLLDLNPFVDRDLSKERIADYTEYQWNGLVYHNKRVGMPRYINLIIFYFNIKLWEKYGVEPPPISGDWDMDDYTEMLKKLTEGARKEGNNNIWAGWIPMWDDVDRFWGPVKSFGGEVVNERYGKICLLDQPPAVEALQYEYDMSYKWNYHAQPLQIESKWPSASFGPQLIMSAQDGVGALMRREVTWYDEAKVEWDIRHVPKGPRGHRVALGTTDCFNIWTGSKVKEEAWTALMWLTDADYQYKYNCKTSGQIPVLKSVMPKWMSELRAAKPRLANVRLETITEAFEWGYPEDQPQFCNSLAAYDILVPALEKVYAVGDVGPEYIVGLVPSINDSQKDCTV